MKNLAIILFSSVLMMSGGALAGPVISGEVGTRNIEFENDVDERANYMGGAFLWKFHMDRQLSLGLGAGLTRNTMDYRDIDMTYTDATFNGVLEYRVDRLTPYARYRYIIWSDGEAEDADMENSGYDIAAGTGIALTRNLSLGVEFAFIADQEIDFEQDVSFGPFTTTVEGDIEYDYTAFQVSVSYRL